MADPINSNLLSNTCPDPTSSNCVTYAGPKPPDCYNVCGTVTITEIEYRTMLKVCNLIDAIDISSLDMKCLCGTGLLQCCPEGWDPVIASGTGEVTSCRNKATGAITASVLIPCPAVPCPDKTLVNVLQLLINKACP